MRIPPCLLLFLLLPSGFGALKVLPQSRVEKATRFLQTAGERLESAELLELGSEVNGPDDLDKVKQMIRHMIAKHSAALSEDTDHKAFCDKELAASKGKVDRLKTDFEKRNADRDLQSAQLAELKDSISDLHAEVAQAHKDRQKAVKLRADEAAEYEKAKASRQAKIAQTHAEARAALDTGSDEKRKAARKAEEDLLLEQVRADNQEQDKTFQFKKLDEDFEVAIAKKTKEIELKEHALVQKNHNLALSDGDFKIAKEEMAAAADYAAKIKTSCVARQDPAKERKRNREEQISSLKEAYGILSGEDIPVLG